ncbi:hypothetical protein [Arsenophonus sp. PmNCSU2021_1]|uniref:hypothetical protein n=1 Tax=Arsenophonus sp. PmNCSU2021_1 TaxID=3118989 RepID=UPI002FF11473
MQKIVALLTGLTKTHAIKKAITFTFASFFILLVSCFYTVGVGAGGISFNAVTQLIKQNPNLEILALFWGMTHTLWILGIFCLGLAIVEYFSQKTTQPRWVNAVVKAKRLFKVDGRNAVLVSDNFADGGIHCSQSRTGCQSNSAVRR